MSLGEILKRANRDAWKDAITWLILNLCLVILPIGFTYLVVLGKTGNVIFQEPISHGELPLFSISLLGAGVYVTLTGMKISGLEININFPGTKLWYSAIFIEALAVAFLFANSFTLNTNLVNYQQILDFWIKITVIMMLLCFATTFVIMLVDASIRVNNPSVEEIFAKSNKNVQDELKKGNWRT